MFDNFSRYSQNELQNFIKNKINCEYDTNLFLNILLNKWISTT